MLFGARNSAIITALSFGKPKYWKWGSSGTRHRVRYLGRLGKSLPDLGGFQELDMGVQATLVRKGNYNYFNKAIPAAASPSEAIRYLASLYLATKPAWFGNLAWPPIRPNFAWFARRNNHLPENPGRLSLREWNKPIWRHRRRRRHFDTDSDPGSGSGSDTDSISRLRHRLRHRRRLRFRLRRSHPFKT